MASTVELIRLDQEQPLVSQRDSAELREQLLQLVRKQDQLNFLLEEPEDVEQLMETLQEVRFHGR